MKLDLSKLSDAVTKVASVASAHTALSSECEALKAECEAYVADHKASQEAIDTLTASLIAATTSPAEAVGLAAVAAAVAPVAPAPEAPVVVADAMATAPVHMVTHMTAEGLVTVPG